MNIIENIREKNTLVTSALYISCAKSFDSEKVISEQLDLLHQFVQANDIIIVDAYIDRDSVENYNRLVCDAQNNYFDVILVYGATACISEIPNAVVIDILADN